MYGVMKKKNMIGKLFAEITLLLVLLSCLSSCSKKASGTSYNLYFQVDLTDTTNHDLLHLDGSKDFSTFNVLVVNSGAGYMAADIICPVCQHMIGHSLSTSGQEYFWQCGFCNSLWYSDGTPFTKDGNDIKIQLNTYPTTQERNMLDINF
jgi:hypothetical protein